MQTIPARRGEVSIGVGLLCVGLYLLWEAWGMPTGTLALPGPAFFPWVLGVLLVLIALGLVGRTAHADLRSAAPVEFGHRDVGLTLLALVGAAAMFEAVGAILSLGLLLFVLCKILARTTWRRAALSAAVGAAATWLVFVYALGVQLPQGWLR